MTWQLASFAVLAFALASGVWWYERTAPSARILAVVATMAALAAIGRIAFAPLPNIKPTTDIVLIAGYALGGAPGFLVGAVTALVSNVFFGHGPYTPWQMVSWGLVGVAGAVLASMTAREIGRVGLALACGGAGLVFGLIMDLHLWILYSGHTAAELSVVLGRGVPFNIAHAVGNVAFALAFGPVLVRALDRVRARSTVRWLPLSEGAGTAAAATVVAVTVCLGGVLVAPRSAEAQSAQVTYLRGAQNTDGGFGGAPGQASSPMHTGWALIGIAAAGQRPADVARNGKTSVDYLVANISRIRETPDLQRTILALAAAGRSVRDVRGRNLVAELVTKRRANGSFGGLVNQTAFGILALRAAGRTVSDATVTRAGRWLAGEQNPDGGFNFAGKGGPSGIDDTAGAVQALVAAGRAPAAIKRAATFLARHQGADGGFGLTPDDPSNAQSTAWAVQGLVAAGRDLNRLRRNGARSPLAYLRSLTMPSGAVRYSRTSAQTPVWVTSQALAALALKALPIVAAPARPTKSKQAAASVSLPATTAALSSSRSPAPAPSAVPSPALSSPGVSPVSPRVRSGARLAGALLAMLLPGGQGA